MFRLLLFLFPVMTLSQSLPQKLQAVLNAHFIPHEPGIALLVMDAGKVVLSKGYGMAYTRKPMAITPKTAFRMASVSKQFTAMAILLLEKEGRLRLSDPLSRYFPELPAWSQQVTIRHMITHTSGIIDGESLLTNEEGRMLPENPWVHNLLDTNYQHLRQIEDRDHLRLLQATDSTYFVPGSQFRYSNSAYCLLALIVEKTARTPFAAFLTERIFKPLGMKGAMAFQPPAPIPNRAFGYARDGSEKWYFNDQSQTSATLGDGGVYLSLNDYARWYSALLNDTLIPIKKVQETLFSVAGPQHRYGAGWFFDTEMWFHSGSTCGFSNFVIAMPASGKLVAWFSNRADDYAAFRKIQTLLIEEGFLKEAVWHWHE
ncbi:MAG TPA: serine hydrolase domain-containing protein, partial [Rhodothermales bacterium]|nr:serine hydrolase domain-containing protein [Rhodothermales bacterium]